MNGDELALVLDGVQMTSATSRSSPIELHQAVHDPFFTIDQHRISATASIGVAIFPTDGRTGIELLASSAKARLQRAKEDGRNRTRGSSAKDVEDGY